jgi:hypothetical protein
MRRHLWLVAWAALTALLSLVALGMPGRALTPAQYLVLFGNAPAAYTGPGDVVSAAVAAWGLRGYNAAYATGSNPAIDICDTSTGLTCTTGIKILSNGKLDVATASGSAACATSCSVTKLYDQTGNGYHLTQATIGKAPVLTFNCLNTSLPCMTFTKANSQFLATSSGPTTALPVSWSFVASQTTAATGNIIGDAAGSTGRSGVFRGSSNSWGLYNASGCCTATASDSAFHAAGAVFNGASSSQSIDGGTAVTGNTGSGANGANYYLCNNQNNSYCDGKITEAEFWGIALTSNQIAALCHDKYAYWGTSASC